MLGELEKEMRDIREGLEVRHRGMLRASRMSGRRRCTARGSNSKVGISQKFRARTPKPRARRVSPGINVSYVRNPGWGEPTEFPRALGVCPRLFVGEFGER